MYVYVYVGIYVFVCMYMCVSICLCVYVYMCLGGGKWRKGDEYNSSRGLEGIRIVGGDR